MHLAYHHFPSDYLETYTDKIRAVSAQDVFDMANKYLTGGHLSISVVGDTSAFDVDFSTFGPVVKPDISIPE